MAYGSKVQGLQKLERAAAKVLEPGGRMLSATEYLGVKGLGVVNRFGSRRGGGLVRAWRQRLDY